MIENPEHETLHLKIEDKKTERKICNLDFNFNELLEQKNLYLDRQFSLDCPGYSARVTMALSLKVRKFYCFILKKIITFLFKRFLLLMILILNQFRKVKQHLKMLIYQKKNLKYNLIVEYLNSF
jgi:hypothetical protein